ncbi:uncharacterized protein TrAFT101_004839 [Trichoderma asperellum]|uniref:Uncharacterized protein n=1 Tax=Trichoderma asperellum (strain ATCC 204424 / CBS 433.97 / NBRC 101777) TaxID=1042311 RepID=A0A2T3Z5M3_TRIA4|nr:hypothetical protein M441DRAFT_47984 [Trichoderma asperellum CBS 433.97]PTB40121.1 hypothetical protein M441DRAFT_47984 [Trichoderma asperellum CBS 433.97]UKZ89798.1 hypothetical protein TrAFT101_004839 [Trichoderma asperellum]
MTLAKSGLALQLLVLTGAANCHPAPHQTPAPELRFLYHLNSSLGEPVSFGPGPSGTKMSIPILGGTVEGPNICGEVMNVGADWGTIDANGTFRADARYQLRTNDSADIFVHVTGPTQPNGQVLNHITFETGSDKYFRLNNIVAVGISTLGQTTVAVDVWEMVNKP